METSASTFANTLESLKQRLADFPLVHRPSSKSEHIGYITSCFSFSCCQETYNYYGTKNCLSTSALPDNFEYFYSSKAVKEKKVETRREKKRNKEQQETTTITTPCTAAETWLIGGTIGNKNTLLLFKSSALANVTPETIHSKPGYKLHITYRVTQTETKLLAKLLHCHGITEAAPEAMDFNILWVGNHPKPGVFRALASHQRINHFPRSYELTRKDRLYKNIERMQHSKGMRNFDFIPQSFIMPGDFKELCSVHYRTRGPWIVKPAASSRGRGIFIVETPYQVPLDEPVIVAKYICNPLLIDGHKCDLRLYVAVTSYDPLLIYIYEEGLVRFATVKYDNNRKQLWNPCMHLCNYSINKYHSDYIKSDDPCAENIGHKWTLSALLRHLKSIGKDTIQLMEHIEDIVVKAIITSANSIISACQMFVPNQQNCFELFGFDILIDEDLKPWLLEVNLSPSLGCDSPLDVRLKSAMLADLLTLIGVPAVDPVVKTGHHNHLSHKTSNLIKMKLGTCRRVHSADGLSQVPKKVPLNQASHTTNLNLTAEETRVLKTAKLQFERRGGWVRIFPTADSWHKYAQYLNPISGIPTSALPNSSSTHIVFAHNFNHLLHQHLFPQIPLKLRHHPIGQPKSGKTLYNAKETKMTKIVERHKRYERKLDVGHWAISLENKKNKNIYDDSKIQVCSMIKNGKLLTQAETRRTFSQYLYCILQRLSAYQEDEDQDSLVELVLSFLQKASQYLRTPFYVPSPQLTGKDRAAIIAKQLNDFLYQYNRETELYSDTVDRLNSVPYKLFTEFLQTASEKELEEVLVSQNLRSVPHCVSSPIHSWGFQGIIKGLPKGVHRHHKKKTGHKNAKHS